MKYLESIKRCCPFCLRDYGKSIELIEDKINLAWRCERHGCIPVNAVIEIDHDRPLLTLLNNI
jgi:hypothetical protein